MATAEVRSSDRILQSALELFSIEGVRRHLGARDLRGGRDHQADALSFLREQGGRLPGAGRRRARGLPLAARRSSSRQPGPVVARLKRVARAYFDAARGQRELMRFIFSIVHNPPASAPATDFSVVLRRDRRAGRAGGGRRRRARRAGAGPDRRCACSLFMGALGEALCGWMIAGRPGADRRAGGRDRRHPAARLEDLTHETTAVLVLLAAVPCAPARRTPSRSRAREAVARALAVNPEVRKSLEDLAHPAGPGRRGDGGRAARAQGARHRHALPRPLPAQQQQLRRVPARAAREPDAGARRTCSTARRELRQTLFSFKLGKAIRAAAWRASWAQEEVQRARQAVGAAGGARLQRVPAEPGEGRGRTRRRCARRRSTWRWRRTAAQAGVATELDVLRSQVDLENTRAHPAAAARRGRPGARPPERGHGAPDRHAHRAARTASTYAPLEITLEEAVRARLEPSARGQGDRAQRAHLRRADRGGAGGVRARASTSTRAYGWSVRQPANFFESDFAQWNARRDPHRPRVRRLPHARARSRRPAPSGTRSTQDRIALENRIRLEAKEGVDRLDGRAAACWRRRS